MTPRYTFRLKPERDSDLINWLDSLGEGERSFFIRQALRQALQPQREGRVTLPKQDILIPAFPVSVNQLSDNPVTGTENENDIEEQLDKLTDIF